jgi:hypothetical protein
LEFDDGKNLAFPIEMQISKVTLLVITALLLQPWAKEVFISDRWNEWFGKWGTTESFFQMKANEPTISLELNTNQVCFEWNHFLESRCFSRTPAKQDSAICWWQGGADRAPDCALFSGRDSLVLRDSTRLARVSSASTVAHMNGKMVAGRYSQDKGKGEVRFHPDGTVTGFEPYNRFHLRLLPNDREPEGIEINFSHGKKTDEFFINKLNGHLVIRKIECLEEDVDPDCIHQLSSGIKYLFRKIPQ